MSRKRRKRGGKGGKKRGGSPGSPAGSVAPPDSHDGKTPKGKAPEEKAPKENPASGEREAKKESAERKKPRSARLLDRAFWLLLLALAGYVISGRFAPSAKPRLAGILNVVQIASAVAFGLILVLMAVLFVKTYPHPLRALNKKLAAERSRLARETRRNKKRKKKRR